MFKFCFLFFYFFFLRFEKMSVVVGNKNYLICLIVVVLIGILVGLFGMVLVLILYVIQYLVFGYSYGQIVGLVLFLQGVMELFWLCCIVVIVVGGVVVGFGWWLFGCYGQRWVFIVVVVVNFCVFMFVGIMMIYVLLQIVIVVLGFLFGCEVVFWEMGVLGVGMVVCKLCLLEDEICMLIVCGVGVGLVVVYNVLLVGVLFSFEVMLLLFSWEKMLVVMMILVIVVWMVILGLGDEL